RLGGGAEAAPGSRQLDISSENIDDLFGSAGRHLGDGLHKAWWRERVARGTIPNDKAKLELVALSLDDDVIDAVERKAQETTAAWLDEHRFAIRKLPEA